MWRPLFIIYKHVKREAVGTGPIGPAISALSFVYRHTGTSLSRFEWILVCYWMLICGTMVDLTSRLCRSGPYLFTFSSNYGTLYIQLEMIMEVWQVLWIVMVAATHRWISHSSQTSLQVIVR